MSLLSAAAATTSSSSKSSNTPSPSPSDPPPPLFNYILAVILVSLAWGLTTPFIRRGALSYNPRPHPSLGPTPSPSSPLRYLRHYILKAAFTIYDLLKTPSYAVPLVINLTGSVWFFLLVGNTELSLTVPVVNSLAFLCTVGGEWWVEGKAVGGDTWVGMGFVLGGIGLCVWSKNG